MDRGSLSAQLNVVERATSDRATVSSAASDALRVATTEAAAGSASAPPLDFEEIYERVTERIRRELLIERERSGEPLWE
jgi:hypothetical protein